MQILDAALRAQLLRGELFEVLLVSPTLVVLEVGRVAVLDGRIAPDPMLCTEIFAGLLLCFF